MNKKTFLISNTLIFLIGVLGILFPGNAVQIIIAWVVVRSISFLFFGLQTLNIKYKIALLLIFIAAIIGVIGGNIIGSGLRLTLKAIVLGVIGMEIYIHLIAAYIQKQSKEKTWIANLLVAMIFFSSFMLIASGSKNSFDLNSDVNENIKSTLNYFAITLVFISSYYYYYLFKNKEVPGSLTLFNVNSSMLNSSYAPKDLYLSLVESSKEELEEIIKKNTIGEFNPDTKYLTVYLHAWKPAIDMMGHSDIVFEGYNYSLSNYDVENEILSGMASNGVISITPEEQYKMYCLKYEGKVLLAYSIPINFKQSQKVQKMIEQFKADSVEWKPKNINNNKAAKNILKRTDSELRLVTKGTFKKYFALGTNCVKLVDVILNEIGYETKVSKNLLTPGEYIKFFDAKTNEENSGIVKRIYWKEKHE
jgi:hypothetical protein